MSESSAIFSLLSQFFQLFRSIFSIFLGIFPHSIAEKNYIFYVSSFIICSFHCSEQIVISAMTCATKRIFDISDIMNFASSNLRQTYGGEKLKHVKAAQHAGLRKVLNKLNCFNLHSQRNDKKMAKFLSEKSFGNFIISCSGR